MGRWRRDGKGVGKADKVTFAADCGATMGIVGVLSRLINRRWAFFFFCVCQFLSPILFPRFFPPFLSPIFPHPFSCFPPPPPLVFPFFVPVYFLPAPSPHPFLGRAFLSVIYKFKWCGCLLKVLLVLYLYAYITQHRHE